MFSHKKILIVGDAGRGKTTFAEKLFRKTNIPHYSTDDFYYIEKFFIKRDKQKSIDDISQVYQKDQWIVEGTTRHLIEPGLDRADVIYLMEFNSIIAQYYFLITRHFRRKNESFKDLFALLKHITFKRYKKDYRNKRIHLHEILKPFESKIVMLNSFRKVNNCLKNF